jgi:hypothetical protein
MFPEDDSEYVVAVLMDLSDSFEPLMSDEGEAYQFLLSLTDRYFRQRIGTNDQLILSQISDSPERTLIWQGSPMELRQRFPDPQSFSAFLRSRAKPQKSRLHDSIVQTVDYMIAQPSVAEGKAATALFVLSDMMDSSPRAAESRARAVASLRTLVDSRGTFGCYFVNQSVFPIWLRELKAAGIDFSVSPDFKRPPMPTFD